MGDVVDLSGAAYHPPMQTNAYGPPVVKIVPRIPANRGEPATPKAAGE